MCKEKTSVNSVGSGGWEAIADREAGAHIKHGRIPETASVEMYSGKNKGGSRALQR